MIDKSQIWPDLPYEDWRATCTTLQLWTQVVGKIRLKFTRGSIIPGTSRYI
jgi:Family of unknown function (DUF5996)